MLIRQLVLAGRSGAETCIDKGDRGERKNEDEAIDRSNRDSVREEGQQLEDAAPGRSSSNHDSKNSRTA